MGGGGAGGVHGRSCWPSRYLCSSTWLENDFKQLKRDVCLRACALHMLLLLAWQIQVGQRHDGDVENAVL